MDPRLLGKSAIEIAIKRTASRYVQGAVAKVPNHGRTEFKSRL